jgi:hypothetical protein
VLHSAGQSLQPARVDENETGSLSSLDSSESPPGRPAAGSRLLSEVASKTDSFSLRRSIGHDIAGRPADRGEWNGFSAAGRPGSAGIAVSASPRATVNESAAIARDSLRPPGGTRFHRDGETWRDLFSLPQCVACFPSPSLSCQLPSSYSRQWAHETCFFLAKAWAPVSSLFLSSFFFLL